MFFFGDRKARNKSASIGQPVPQNMAYALAAAYGLMVDINCSPRALAVAAAGLNPLILNYKPGATIGSTLLLVVPSNAVASNSVAQELIEWHRRTVFYVLVDNETTSYGYTFPPSQYLYLSGQVCPRTVKSQSLKHLINCGRSLSPLRLPMKISSTSLIYGNGISYTLP